MIEINFTENNIFLFFFSWLNFKEYPYKKVRGSKREFADRIENEKEYQSRNA
jgi:hypothetical protein